MNSSIETANAIIARGDDPRQRLGQRRCARTCAMGARRGRVAASSWLRSRPSSRTSTSSVTTGGSGCVWPAMIVQRPRWIPRALSADDDRRGRARPAAGTGASRCTARLACCGRGLECARAGRPPRVPSTSAELTAAVATLRLVQKASISGVVVEHSLEPAEGEARNGKPTGGVVEREQDEQRDRASRGTRGRRASSANRKGARWGVNAARVLARGGDRASDRAQREQEQEDADQQHERQCRAEPPLHRGAELVDHQVRVERPLGAADQLRRDVVADHRDEGDDEAGEQARIAASGRVIRSSTRQGRAPRSAAASQQRRIHPLDGDVGRRGRPAGRAGTRR